LFLVGAEGKTEYFYQLMSVFWENQLAEIRNEVLRMSGLAERNFARAAKALMERDEVIALEVEEADNEVDRLEVRIDDLVITYISTHGPIAGDCRFLITASKISNELERIADQATTIARRTRDLNRIPALGSLIGIPKMVEDVEWMIRESIRALVERDTDLALEVIGKDKRVDELYRDTARAIEAAIVADPTTTAQELHLLTVAKAIERAGDHATNIAEEVFFLFKAEDIRHQHRV
jgi:phosphate transport system protein